MIGFDWYLGGPKSAVPSCYGIARLNHYPGTRKFWHAFWPDPKYPIDFMIDGGMCVATQLESEDKPFTLGLDGVASCEL